MFNHDITGDLWSPNLDVGTTHGHKLHYFKTQKSACGHATLSSRKIGRNYFVNPKEYPERRFCLTCIKKRGNN